MICATYKVHMFVALPMMQVVEFLALTDFLLGMEDIILWSQPHDDGQHSAWHGIKRRV